MRVVSISIIAVLAIAAMLLTARYWGLGRSFPIFNNAFLINEMKSTPWIVVPWDSDNLKSDYPNAVLWADVYVGKNGTLLVSPYSEAKKNLKNPCDTSSCLELSKWLSEHKTSKTILNIASNVMDIDRMVASLFETKDVSRIAIQSEYTSVSESIKRLKPMFAYGSSQPERVRLAVFAALFILPAAPFHADFYIGPLSAGKISVVDDEILGEVRRRNIPIVLGPLSTQDDVDQALLLKADGLFLDQSGFAVLPIAK